MYSTHNERKSVFAERFIRVLKENRIYKYVILVSKNVYIDNLDDIVNEYNNAHHRTIETKPVEFYNRSMKSWLKDNDLTMYLPHDEGKSVFAERFIRTLKKEQNLQIYDFNIKTCVYLQIKQQ